MKMKQEAWAVGRMKKCWPGKHYKKSLCFWRQSNIVMNGNNTLVQHVTLLLLNCKTQWVLAQWFRYSQKMHKNVHFAKMHKLPLRIRHFAKIHPKIQFMVGRDLAFIFWYESWYLHEMFFCLVGLTKHSCLYPHYRWNKKNHQSSTVLCQSNKYYTHHSVVCVGSCKWARGPMSTHFMELQKQFHKAASRNFYSMHRVVILNRRFSLIFHSTNHLISHQKCSCTIIMHIVSSFV